MLSDGVVTAYRMDCIGVHAYTPPVTYGDRVRWYREEKGWSQALLARRAHIDPGSINRIESGKIKYGTKSRVNIARALGIPVAALDPDSPAPTAKESRDDIGGASAAFDTLDDAQLVTALAAFIKELERRQSRPASSDSPPPTSPDESSPPRRKRR